MAGPIRYDERGGGDQLVYGEKADGDEIPVAASVAGELHVFPDLSSRDLLRGILAELRMINIHLLSITGEQICT